MYHRRDQESDVGDRRYPKRSKLPGSTERTFASALVKTVGSGCRCGNRAALDGEKSRSRGLEVARRGKWRERQAPDVENDRHARPKRRSASTSSVITTMAPTDGGSYPGQDLSLPQLLYATKRKLRDATFRGGRCAEPDHAHRPITQTHIELRQF